MMKRKRFVLFGAVLVGMAGMLGAGGPIQDQTQMPVYRLQKAAVDKGRSGEMFRKNMGAAGAMQETPNAVVHRSGQKVLEVDKRSGHVFMGDMEKLWNPKAAGANVPDHARARAVADRFMEENGLNPKGDGNANMVFSHFSETMSGEDAPGQVVKKLLDQQVNYAVKVKARVAGKDQEFPVVGGGGKAKVFVGEGEKVVGFSGGWRQTAGVEKMERIMGETAAVNEVKGRLKGTELKNVKAELAYYSAPAFEEQTVLAPVWVVNGEIQVGNESVPMRAQIVAATSYGPKFEQVPADKARNPGERPEPKGKDNEGSGSQGWLDRFVKPAFASPAAAGFECGASYIGVSGGLGGSAGNVKGFTDQCKAAGWGVPFSFGDANAWEKDWRVNDDSYIDNVDLVFYTGHASPSGWQLASPDDTQLSYTEVQNGGSDFYGNGDVEWIIIAACGPMQSTHFTTNTTNAFDRWRGIFDGLHIFLGYGAVTYDNTSEGRRFMELTRAGWGVIDAWFRTALEIQPATNTYAAPNGPNIKVTAMYAHNGDHCARNEKLWGMGTVCSDVTGSAQVRTFLWAGT